MANEEANKQNQQNVKPPPANDSGASKGEKDSLNNRQKPLERPERAYVEDAIRHQRANMVGKIDKTRPIERCPCCSKNINQDPYSMCVHSSEINEHGAGFALYFYYMKLVAILALTIAIPHIPKIFINSFAGRCDEYPGTRECVLNHVTVHSIANFGYWERDYVHLALVIVSVILFVIVYTYLEYRAEIYASNLEKTAITVKDYSVQARDVGTEVTKEDLIKYCEEKGAKVKEIEFAYFIPESKKIEKEQQVFRKHISRSD